LRGILFPLRWVYQGATGFRNWLYDKRIKRAHVVSAKVVSVGNLTVGGTGKTPVTLALIDAIRERGFTCGAVSRGYKRDKPGVLKVELGPSAASEFGDEPVLIKSSFPDIPVWVGEKKVQAARKLLEASPVQFLVCDDAFQHRALSRDLNLLLLDATEPMSNYRVMPVGRGRESLVPALRRADYFVLTKTNLATNEQLKDLIFWLKDKSEKPVLLAAYGFNGFRSVGGEHVPSLKDAAYVISGVARPDTVDRLLESRIKVVKHKTFDDHHRYTHLEIEAILDEASHMQARWIVTTPKDAVKLAAFHGLRDRLWVIDMAVQFEGDLKTFYADIDRLAGARN
jgi:tetraacyldisaccharide 4'-kinase